MKGNYFAQTVKLTAPLFFGYLAAGIPFGLMLVDAGYPVWLAPLMSVTIYTGAGQYMAIGLLSAGASLGAIVVAELLMGVRHIVYGLSLITKYKNVGRWRPYLIFALTDETYSIIANSEPPEGCDAGTFYGMISMLAHGYWIFSSSIGAVAGKLIPFSFEGVDFALTALFIVLFVEQLKTSFDLLPIAIGSLTTLAVIVISRLGFIPNGNILSVALPLSLAILILLRGRKFNKPNAGGANGETETEARQ